MVSPARQLSYLTELSRANETAVGAVPTILEGNFRHALSGKLHRNNLSGEPAVFLEVGVLAINDLNALQLLIAHVGLRVDRSAAISFVTCSTC